MFEPVDPKLTGHIMIDTHAEKVGKVTDVLYDEAGQEPRWAVVKTGLFGGEHYVPLVESYVDKDGFVVVPLTRARIKHAPRAGDVHLLDRATREQLQSYYGVAA